MRMLGNSQLNNLTAGVFIAGIMVEVKAEGVLSSMHTQFTSSFFFHFGAIGFICYYITTFYFQLV